jgi:hypothetical protein
MEVESTCTHRTMITSFTVRRNAFCHTVRAREEEALAELDADEQGAAVPSSAAN